MRQKESKSYAKLLALGAEIVVASDNALELADAYQAHGILTPKFYLSLKPQGWKDDMTKNPEA